MKISNFLVFPVITSGSIALFVAIFFIFFYQFSERYRESKSALVAKAIVQNIQNEIQERVDTINSFGADGLLRTEGVQKEFGEFCERFIKLFPDIFAVNFVDSQGIIQRVYPLDQNRSALKKDLMKHPEVGDYLKLSLSEKKPVLSHRIKTYQGFMGYALYVPVYNQYGLHVGFLNIVFNLDEWLKQYLLENDWQNTRVQIQWEKNPDFVFDEGPTTVSFNFEKKIKILNQESTIRLGFVPSFIDKKQNTYRWSIFGFGVFLIVFIFALTFVRVKNEYQLRMTNKNLETSQALIGSLSHDIANPFFSLNLVLSKWMNSEQPLAEDDKKRISGLLKSINEMLEAGKTLQSLRLGKSQLEISKVNLKEAIQSACQTLVDRLDSKSIKVDLESVSSELLVQAEKRTLTYNVLANVLTNSIKFSPSGEVIKIYTEESDGYCHLIIEDNGLGVNQAQLKPKDLKSQTGTQGETGYGFGLMQVEYFMNAFKGQFEIGNKITGTGARVVLKFLKA